MVAEGVKQQIIQRDFKIEEKLRTENYGKRINNNVICLFAKSPDSLQSMGSGKPDFLSFTVLLEIQLKFMTIESMMLSNRLILCESYYIVCPKGILISAL